MSLIISLSWGHRLAQDSRWQRAESPMLCSAGIARVCRSQSPGGATSTPVPPRPRRFARGPVPPHARCCSASPELCLDPQGGGTAQHGARVGTSGGARAEEAPARLDGTWDTHELLTPSFQCWDKPVLRVLFSWLFCVFCNLLDEGDKKSYALLSQMYLIKISLRDS